VLQWLVVQPTPSRVQLAMTRWWVMPTIQQISMVAQVTIPSLVVQTLKPLTVAQVTIPSTVVGALTSLTVTKVMTRSP
jgi:hypothetical protein